ncbi:MAG: peptide chain release factor 2 [Candidatus Sumerlaeia bacterium]|nr:peptide chain release factor 2 [Candidatus Sumerlaeia bacterium]
MTLTETISLLEELRHSCQSKGGIFDVDALKQQIGSMEMETQHPTFWNDADRARKTMRQLDELKETVEPWEALEAEIVENLELARLLKEEGQSESEDAQTLGQLATELADRHEKLEIRSILTEESDRLPCFLHINSGAGGTEADDWASMLMRMYVRWAERRDYKVELLDLQEGSEAGISNAQLRIEGFMAYGYLKAESGVHRLVRISPYDSNARRHTSFASVYASPEVDENIEIDIGVKDKDWRIDTFRASGKGGQKVNKTSSAVRIVHFPTNTIVSCQNERSFHQNRDLAFQIMRSRLYALELEKRRQAADALEAQKSDVNFGSQIRSYVLQPYQLVRDERTEIKVSDVHRVLDGDLDEFIEGFLKSKLREKAAKRGGA